MSGDESLVVYQLLTMLGMAANIGAAILLTAQTSALRKGRALSQLLLVQALILTLLLIETTQQTLDGQIVWDGAQLILDGVLGAMYLRLVAAYIGEPTQWLHRTAAGVGAVSVAAG